MKKFISIIVIIVFIIFIVRGWWNNQLAQVSSDQSSKVFVIGKGMGVSEIAKKLKEDNLIKSELVFKLYVRQNNLTNNLQAGSYKLSPSMSVSELLENIQAGSTDTWITLIEGWRIEEMAEKLSSELGVQSSEFLKNAKEGYMFPDTYLLPKDFTVEQIVKKLRDNFDVKYSDELKSRIRALGLTEDQGVILASIVEREARSDEARKMVASILLKRFKIGMGLNADATIQYILGYQSSEKSWWKRHLTRDDLKINSPYNTYLHRGLPPTPICNPGLASLQAVANADSSTPYLYYYHDSEGNSHYGKTLEEHNQNIATYP
ncbi:endolytic transglycosylase MltG [Patescibacteria group bacterium]|nr:endolytic transglycosylase MltG [Patescibacteria group bacterium]